MLTKYGSNYRLLLYFVILEKSLAVIYMELTQRQVQTSLERQGKRTGQPINVGAAADNGSAGR